MNASKGKIIAIVVIVLLVLGAIGSCMNGEEPSAEKSNTSQESSPAVIKLVAGEKGDYGKELVMSEGTDQEEELIVYYLPAGDYEVKNVGSHPAQVSAYEGIEKNSDGYDEYTDAIKPLLIDAGKTDEISIPDGWFIEIHEPDEIELTLK